MGKILWGNGISRIRNKVGSVVYSDNHFGGFVRNLAIPFNPKTSKQNAIRAELRRLSQRFQTIGAQNIIDWNAYGASKAYFDRFGQPYYLTGQEAYCQLNMNLYMVGESTVDTAPTSEVFFALISPVLTATGGSSVSLAFDGPVPAGTAMIIDATDAESLGKTYLKKKKFIKYAAAAGTSPQSITTEWEAIYGSVPAANKQIKVFCRYIDTTTGISGPVETSVSQF